MANQKGPVGLAGSASSPLKAFTDKLINSGSVTLIYTSDVVGAGGTNPTGWLQANIAKNGGTIAGGNILTTANATATAAVGSLSGTSVTVTYTPSGTLTGSPAAGTGTVASCVYVTDGTNILLVDSGTTSIANNNTYTPQPFSYTINQP